MIDLRRKLKNFGPLEFLVSFSLIYVLIMLIWTGSTRSDIEKKANLLKQNHKNVVEFMNEQVNKCSSNENSLTAWGEKCGDVWSSQKIVKFILNSLDLN